MLINSLGELDTANGSGLLQLVGLNQLRHGNMKLATVQRTFNNHLLAMRQMHHKFALKRPSID